MNEGTGFSGPLFNNAQPRRVAPGAHFLGPALHRPDLRQLPPSLGLRGGGLLPRPLGWPNYRSVIFTETLDGRPLPQGSTEVVVEPPGAARSPAVPLLDLRLDHRLELPGRTELSTFFDVFNALNGNHVVGEGSRDDSFGAVVGILPPRVARVGVRLRF